MSETLRFVNPLETVLFLKSLPLLRGLGYSELGLLARQAHERHFKRGSQLLRPDRPITSFYLIVDGEVRVERDGVEEMIAKPGQNLGLLYFFARIRRGVDATALSDVRALEFASKTLLDVFEDHFSILRNTVRNMGALSLQIVRETANGTYKAPREGEEVPADRPLDLVERIERIRYSDMFERVSLDALAEMAMSMQQVGFEKGQTIWKPGEPSGFLCGLLTGRVLCRFDDGQKSFRAGPGYPLGSVESIAGENRWYEAVAETDVTALRSDTSVFLDTLEDHFDLALEFLQASAVNILGYMSERALGDLQEQQAP